MRRMRSKTGSPKRLVGEAAAGLARGATEGDVAVAIARL